MVFQFSFRIHFVEYEKMRKVDVLEFKTQFKIPEKSCKQIIYYFLKVNFLGTVASATVFLNNHCL